MLREVGALLSDVAQPDVDVAPGVVQNSPGNCLGDTLMCHQTAASTANDVDQLRLAPVQAVQVWGRVMDRQSQANDVLPRVFVQLGKSSHRVGWYGFEEVVHSQSQPLIHFQTPTAIMKIGIIGQNTARITAPD